MIVRRHAAAALLCTLVCLPSPAAAEPGSTAETPAASPGSDPSAAPATPSTGTPPASAPALLPSSAPSTTALTTPNGAAGPSPAVAPPSLDPERSLAAPQPKRPRSVGARVELAVVSAGMGAVAGSMVCVSTECESSRSLAGAALGGAVFTLTTSLLATTRGVDSSTVQAIEGGAVWGFATPWYIALITQPERGEEALPAAAVAGGVVGAGLGVLLERTLRPSSGALGVAHSGGLWLPSMTGLLAVGDSAVDAQRLGIALLTTQFVGLGLGGLLGQRDGATRGAAWLADACALGLGGTVPLLTWLTTGDADPLLANLAGVGIGAGYAAGYLLATRLPRRAAAVADLAERVQLTGAPVPGGALLGLRGRL